MRIAGLLIFLMMSGGCSGEQLEALVDPVQLDFQKHRELFMEIDRLVYDSRPLTDRRRALLRERFLELSATARAEYPDNRYMKMHLMTIDSYAERSKTLSERELKAMQKDWVGVRFAFVDDEALLARSASDLDHTSTALDAPETPPMILTTAPAPLVRSAGVLGIRPSRAGLEGRWKLKDAFSNDQPLVDSDIRNAIWNFSSDTLSLEGSAATEHYTRETVAAQTGNGMRLIKADGTPAGGMIWAMEGGLLRVSFYDGLGELPAAFGPRARTGGKALVTILLVRADEQ